MVKYKTNRKKINLTKVILFVAIAVSVALVSFGVVYYNTYHPPVHDDTAVVGTPNPPSDLGYGAFYSRELQHYGACGNLTLNDDSVDVYATFLSATDDCVAQAFIVDSNTDEVLGESGLINQGEYVQTIKLDKVPKTTTDVDIKFKAYEPDTFYSAGVFTFSTVLNVDNS